MAPILQLPKYVPTSGPADDDDVPHVLQSVAVKAPSGAVKIKRFGFGVENDIGVHLEVGGQVVRESPRDRQCAVREGIGIALW